jgi:hypothetical protein
MALWTHDTFKKVDFIGMNDQIYALNKQTAHLQDCHVDHATLAARIAKVETGLTRVEMVRTKIWATKADLKNKEVDLEKSMLAKIQNQRPTQGQLDIHRHQVHNASITYRGRIAPPGGYSSPTRNGR